MKKHFPFYLDYAGGHFEGWWYKNGKKQRSEKTFTDYGEVLNFYKRSPFTELVKTKEAEYFAKLKP